MNNFEAYYRSIVESIFKQVAPDDPRMAVHNKIENWLNAIFAGYGVREILKLADEGMDIDMRSCYNWTTLHHMAFEGYSKSCSLLMDRGANPHLKAKDILPDSDFQGDAAELAEHYGHPITAEFIRKHPAWLMHQAKPAE